MRTFLIRRLALLPFALLAVVALSRPAFAGDETDIPSVNGDLGTCTAAFTVHDGSGKPIYDAKIDITIRYGFLDKRQTELTVGTNSDGKARFMGLPNSPKRPLDFQIKSGDASREISYDPSTNCKASFDVTLSLH